MTPGITTVTLGRTQFVTGLFWHTLTAAKSSAIKEEIALRSLELQAPYCVHLPGWFRQVGFLTPPKGGGWRKRFSLAATVLQSAQRSNLPSNWLGAFALPNQQVWVVAVREGALAPTGDWAGDEAAAQQHFAHFFQQGGWEQVNAPAGWGVPDATERALTELLPHDRKGRPVAGRGAQLTGTRDSGRAVGRVLLALLVLAGAGGWFGYQHWQGVQEKERLAELARRAAAIPPKRPEPVRLPHPWPDRPRVGTFLAHCDTALRQVPRLPGGWTLRSAVCDANQTQAVYDRGTSTVGQLKRALPGAVFALQGNSAQMTWPGRMPPSQDDERPPTFTQAMEWLLATGQAIGARVQLTDIPAATPAAAKSRDAMAPPPPIQDWRELGFVLETSLTPGAAAVLFEIPGLRVATVTLKPTALADVYAFEGKSYVQK